MTRLKQGKHVALDTGNMEDGPMRRSFQAIHEYLREHPFQAFSGSLMQLAVTVTTATDIPHTLPFQPLDVLLLSVNPTRLSSETTDPAVPTVTFDPRYHTAPTATAPGTLRVTASHACTIRCLVGTFGG